MMIGSKIIHLESVDSTNNYAANLVHQGNYAHGTVILSDDQFLGKGQRGSEWLTKKGENLTCSFIICPDKLAVDDQFYLTCLIALSTVDTLKEYGIDATIKWPNDIYVKQKKIAGILIENFLQGNLIKTSIIGIGLNVNSCPNAFNAICMQDLISETLKPFDVLIRLIAKLNNWSPIFFNISFNILLTSYNNRLYGMNQLLKFEDDQGTFHGKVLKVTSNGMLEIEVENEIRNYGIKQIIWHFESTT
jgi:BirA family biotin operon repressor/biotin-[acetyl-CoA-carboxylase] ligase